MKKVFTTLCLLLIVSTTACTTKKTTIEKFDAGCTEAAYEDGTCDLVQVTKISETCRFTYCTDEQVAQIKELGGFYGRIGIGPISVVTAMGTGSSSAIPIAGDVELVSDGTVSADSNGKSVLTGYGRRLVFGGDVRYVDDGEAEPEAPADEVLFAP